MLTLINAQIPTYRGKQALFINEDGKIGNISPMSSHEPLAGEVKDLKGDWLSLGGIDLQINGGLGLAFPT